MPDQGTGGLLSPFLRRARFRAAVPFIRGSVLDFGCGVGELAQFCDESRYCGVDRDAAVVQTAKSRFPRCRFSTELPSGEKFDTIIGLAVIEHMRDPEALLRQLRDVVALDGRLILTTPHPWFRWAHDLGARVGVFSGEASEEHETFFDAKLMRETARRASWEVLESKRFLFGANQLFVLKRA